MEQIVDFSKSIGIFGGADGPTSVFLAGKPAMGVMIAGVVIGLLICLFGLKLVRLLTALTGGIIGLGIGAVIAVVAGVEGIPFIAIMAVCAVVLAAVSFLLYRFGVFCMTFFISIAFIGALLPGNSLPIVITMYAVSLLLAVLSAIYVEPIVIVLTAVYGGIMVGTMAGRLANLDDWMGYVAGAVIAVIGMVLQFTMQSRKVGKKERDYADEIKEKVSMELEVEKARNILDEEEDDEEE